MGKIQVKIVLVVVVGLLLVGWVREIKHSAVLAAQYKTLKVQADSLEKVADLREAAMIKRDSARADSVKKQRAVISAAEARFKKAEFKSDSIANELARQLPDTLKPLLDSLVVAHDAEIAEKDTQIRSLIMLERMALSKVAERDTLIQDLKQANAALKKALAACEKQSEPGFLSKALPWGVAAVASGLALMK